MLSSNPTMVMTSDPVIMPGRPEKQPTAASLFLKSTLSPPRQPPPQIESTRKYTSEYNNEFMPLTFNIHDDGTKRDIPSREQLLRSVGDYNLIRTLGSGSTAKVKLAKHKHTGELVAIKIVNRKKFKLAVASSKKGETLQHKESRIIREALVMHLLDHPNIVNLKDLMITDDWFILIFEYIEGVQLLDFIVSHTKLRERIARKLFRQLLSAVDFIHKHSIVHRDLKIENIIISSSDGCLKLLDFGLSNFYEPNDVLKTFCGSLYFAAPELLHGRPYIGPEVDIWSLGVILYTMVVGKVPFDNPNLTALHEIIKKGDFECPEYLSPDLKRLLHNMLRAEPKGRANLVEVARSDWVTNRGAEPLAIPNDNFVVPIERIDPNALRYLKLHATFQYTPEVIEKVLYEAVEDWPRYMNHPLVSLYKLYMEKSQKKERNKALESFENISLMDKIEIIEPADSGRERQRTQSLQTDSIAANTETRKSSLPTETYYNPPVSPLHSADLLPLKQVYLRGIFSAHLSTSRNPQDLKRRIITALTDLGIEFEDHLTYISCRHRPSISGEKVELSEPVAFDILIVKVMLLGAYGVQLKRISGSYVPYRKLCSLLLSKIR